ncbi:MAG: hypothetical protein VSS75_032805 [Candidatus Parabeggiatoa sp.]|nr:hypothetical protein [Candidatus Parabeggiatoa sp.]
MKTLIIDNNRAFRTLVASFVRRYDPIGEILESSSIEQTMSLLRDNSFVDVIILDSISFPEIGIQHEHGKLVEVKEKPNTSQKLSHFKEKLKRIYA